MLSQIGEKKDKTESFENYLKQFVWRRIIQKYIFCFQRKYLKITFNFDFLSIYHKDHWLSGLEDRTLRVKQKTTYLLKSS